MDNPTFPKIFRATACLLLLSLAAGPALANDGVTFTDVTAAAGVAYARTPSGHNAVLIGLMSDSLSQPVTFMDMPSFPMFPRGAPGVAIVDYDGDGDLDLYVTNGPGSANGLFANQLAETGALRFVDVAAAAGVEAVDQDSTGVCYGDIDNDGDADLMVLGRNESNRLFENRGDGTFTDITAAAGVAGGALGSSGCSFGDVDNDGLLDLVVANTFDWQSLVPIAVEPYAFNQANELYRNAGGNRFDDVSAASGIRDNDLLPPGAAAISWAVTMVDADQDGDTDVVFADDQGAIPPGIGLDRGYLQLFVNDGSGHFTATAQGTTGGWMGQAWADFDCDGELDVFGSNFGDYMMPFMGMPYTVGEQSSRWLLGAGAGQLLDPGVGDLVATVFGWGSAAEDFDNDGDTDVAYHGGLDLTLVLEASNPGALLLNDGCDGSFTLAGGAFAIEHGRRMVQGVAAGDLDGDGFVDLVSVASEVAFPPLPLIPFPFAYGSPFDGVASFAPRFAETSPGSGEFVWAGFDFADGDLSIEINDGVGGSPSVSVSLVGGVGLAAGAAVNRDGIGAVVRFTPDGGRSAVRPVTAGSSFASAHAHARVFGFGAAREGTVDVLWPGGVRNRLYGLRGGERITMPEIPCSYDRGERLGPYAVCVTRALRDYVTAGVISPRDAARLTVSALRAFRDARR